MESKQSKAANEIQITEWKIKRELNLEMTFTNSPVYDDVKSILIDQLFVFVFVFFFSPGEMGRN